MGYIHKDNVAIHHSKKGDTMLKYAFLDRSGQPGMMYVAIPKGYQLVPTGQAKEFDLEEEVSKPSEPKTKEERFKEIRKEIDSTIEQMIKHNRSPKDIDKFVKEKLAKEFPDAIAISTQDLKELAKKDPMDFLKAMMTLGDKFGKENDEEDDEGCGDPDCKACEIKRLLSKLSN